MYPWPTRPNTGGTVSVTVTGQDGTEISIMSAILTFTDRDWDEPQAITVTAATDDDEDNEMVILTNTASDGGYTGITRDLNITVRENDQRGVTVEPNSLSIDEGDEVTYTVVLDDRPTGTMRVDFDLPYGPGFTLNPPP